MLHSISGDTMTGRAVYLRSIGDIADIEFSDGFAEVDVPIELIDQLPLIGADRPDSKRLERLVRSIRSEGYRGGARIVVQVDREGRWNVIDGGHRLTAARRVAKEFWSNLFGRKVRVLHFVLHQAKPHCRTEAE